MYTLQFDCSTTLSWKSRDILRINDTDTDTDMLWLVFFFLATWANFSCRWTVGVDDIKDENYTKKYIIKNIFYILKEQLNDFFFLFFYVTDKYSTNDIIYA